MDEARAAEKLKHIYDANKSRLNLTQKEVAKQYKTKSGDGITQGAVGHYLNGKAPLNAWACSEFARILQVQVSDFAPLPVLRELNALIGDSPDEFFEVSYYKRKFSAGPGADDGNAEEKLMFRRDWAEREGLRPDQLTAVDVSGDSMWPQIQDGDTVLVRRDKNIIESGKIYAFDHLKEQRIKRVYRSGKSSIVLISDNVNKKSEPEVISRGDLNDIVVIGLVIMRIGFVH